MSDFSYKTRIGDSPQGKQKIYFCCHPEDFDKYFDTVTSDIFKCAENCAIYYSKADDSMSPEEFESRLSEIRAFVIPVTLKLLTEKSSAMDIEIPLAQKHHIPLIPIAFEGDLDKNFGEKIGNVQYLDKLLEDDTAISYEEKLKKLIDALLIGTETEKKIREEFAARIFMSYRKKDREHAQKVMKEIHKVDFCRDVAIWYDEYLVPGEDFNDAIKAAIEGCDVFAMTVTPNLLEKGNYVGEHEYPAAKRLGKPRMPVEAVKTKGLKLSKYYFGIKTPADINSSADVERALRASLIGEAGRKDLLTTNEEPDHLYYMGLAYKNGIDVELDPERAIELFEKAGESKAAAFLEIARMHEHGEGVPRDYEEAVRYYDKFIAAAEKAIGSDPDDDAVLLGALESKGDILVRTGKYEDAEDTFNKQVDIVQRMVHDHGSNNVIYLIGIYEKLGDLNRKQGRSDSAKQQYTNQLFWLGMLGELLPAETITQFKINCLGRLGDISREQGDEKSAENYYGKISEMLEKTSGDEHSGDMYARAISNERQGDALLWEGENQKALEHYKAAMKSLRKLATDSGDVQVRKALAVECGKVGSVYVKLGKYKEAEKILTEAYELKKEMVTDLDDLDARRTLSVTCSQLANLFTEQEDWDNGKKYLEEDLKLSEDIALKTDSPEDWANLATTWQGLGSLKTLSFNDRRHCLTNAYNIYGMLCNQKGLTEYAFEQRQVEMYYNQVYAEDQERKAKARQAEEDRKQAAEERMEEILTSSKKLVTEAAEYAEKKQYSTALETYMKAEKFTEGILREYLVLEEIEKDVIYRHLSLIYVRLGEIYEAQGKMKDARKYYEKDLGIARTLASHSGTVQTRDDLAVSCYKMGMLEEIDVEERVKYLSEAEEIWQQLYKETGVREYYSRAATMASHICRIQPLNFHF